MKYLFSRKHRGETYRFYRLSFTSWIDGSTVNQVIVKTPENAFGYPDTVTLDSDGTAHTAYRYLAPGVLKALAKQMYAAESKYCKGARMIADLFGTLFTAAAYIALAFIVGR